MSFYTVDSQSCIRCGLCSQVCTTRIIKADSNGLPFIPEERTTSCIRCGQCVVFCPEACNSLAFQDGPLPLIDASLFPSPQSAETLLRSRRSIRNFKAQPAPRELLERALETARYAPTAQNLQSIRWLVLESSEKVAELERQVIESFKELSENPPLGVSPKQAATLKGIVKVFEAGIPIIFRGAPHLAIAIAPTGGNFTTEDGVVALTYLELAAHALGLGCCWAGFFTLACRASRTLCNALGLKESEQVVGAQMLGYPLYGLSKRLPPRKEIEVTWL
ncbi:MAG: 4Fe-4S binding protein [Fretibacterium sp.]|nr:4Fe-4S binding protein [Fretibacterium sp.]